MFNNNINKIIIIIISICLIGCAANRYSIVINSNLDKMAKYEEAPLKNGYKDWAEFREIVNIGEEANPILLELLTSDKETSIIFYGHKETIGDLSLSLLCEINNFKYTDVLPEKVVIKWKEIGVFSYYDYVKDKSNRYVLKEKVENRIKQNDNVEKEWKLLLSTKGCLAGGQYVRSDGRVGGEGCCFDIDKRWGNFLRIDKNIVVPYLISKITSAQPTKTHVCPFDIAIEGELAIYCLQYVLKINWFDLSPSYSKENSSQKELQRIIRTEAGAKEMTNLWLSYYDKTK